jgi:hypothetical protein
MPFRKLPITDSELQNTLRNLIFAYDVRVTHQPDETRRVCAFSPETFASLIELQLLFNKEINERKGALAFQTGQTRLKRAALKKLKKYVDHFFIVLNLAIDRGLFDPTIRAYYGLNVYQRHIPVIFSHNKVSGWALNIISGETSRITEGGLPMQFPSLTDVQAAYDDYSAKQQSQSTLKSNYDTQQEDVEHLRKRVKSVIRDAWDQIEFYFRKEVPSSLRHKARGWGVDYGYRKGEKPEEGEE